MSADGTAAIEVVVRASYGRLLAVLASRDGDIELAEECLATAIASAVQAWPAAGTPANPQAWLLTVARHHRADLQRSAAHRLSEPIAAIHDRAASADASISDVDAIPDRRLALLCVCAHPEIDLAARTPLMLQTVLGIESERIARAFAVPASTMAQRLVRAKHRIRDAGIPFEVPGREAIAARLPAVLEAIYGAYAIEFPLVAGVEPRDTLAFESLHLATTLAELVPDEPEALGLAAMISLSIARRPAHDHGSAFVPLQDQDPGRWNRACILQGERYLHAARALGRIGRFQLEAAIQSVHCARASSGVTDWLALQKLYAALLVVAPTLGGRVAHAATLGQVSGPAAGLRALDAITDAAVVRFQPAWATRAHLLAAAGSPDAAAAFARAIALTTDERARRYLESRLTSLVPPDVAP